MISVSIFVGGVGSMTSFEFMMCGWQNRKQQIMHPQTHSKQRSIRAVVSQGCL